MNKDLLEYIFIRVQDMDLPNLRLTCKRFKEIVDSKTFWMNKIIYKYPCLNYRRTLKDKTRYFYLKNLFKETNLYYISAIAQYNTVFDVLLILNSFSDFHHSIPNYTLYPNKKIETEFYLSPNNTLEGPFIEYYENGNIKEMCFFKNDLRHGLCIIKNFNNEIIEYGSYIEDKKEGTFIYCEEENLEIVCFYKNNLLNGEFISYINGIVFESTYYVDSVQHGRFKRYDSCGRINKEGYYYQGRRTGTWKEYENNILIKEFKFI